MGIKKPGRAEVFQNIVLAMRGENPTTEHDFPDRYHVIEPEYGVREILLEISQNRVSFCQLAGVAGSVLRYCNEILKGDFMITYKQAQEIATMWVHSVNPIPMPKLFSFTGEDGLAFHRAPFASPSKCDEPPPLFADILRRSTNADSLAAFIGSIFFEDSDRQQYLYLHGDGMNGKGALIDVLDLALGPGLHSEVTPDEKKGTGTHWTSGFLGKRLVVFTECESPKFPTSGIFKSLTGGDKTLINQKYKAAFSTKLNCKFIFLANNELMISSSKADQRRAIYSYIKPNPNFIDDYSRKLLAEAPQIIGYCMKKYGEICPDNRAIPIGDADVLSLLDLNQAHFFEHYFVLNPGGLVCLSAVQRLFKQEKIFSSVDQGKFYDYIRLRHHVHKVPKGPNNDRVWFLAGVSLSKDCDWATTGLNIRALKHVGETPVKGCEAPGETPSNP